METTGIVELMEQEVRWDVDRGTLHIDKDLVMRPITFDEEMARLLKNKIAWCQRCRREDKRKIHYFQSLPQDDMNERIVIGIQEGIKFYDGLEKACKSELTKYKSRKEVKT